MSTPYIPEQLGALYDASAQEVHTRYRGVEYAELKAKLPELREFEHSGNSLLYADIKPIAMADETDALVVALPFASGWAVNRYLRARMAHALSAPDKRLIILPGSSIGQESITLTSSNTELVANGDISPIAEMDARLLDSLGISSVALVGYSFGAMRVANGASVIGQSAEVTNIGVFDPPNGVDRTPKQLQKDFQKSGLDTFVEAVKDADIPALAADFGITEKTKQFSPRVLKDVVRFGLSSLTGVNPALRLAMASDSLTSDVSDALDIAQSVLLVNAKQSAILPSESALEIAQELKRRKGFSHVEVAGKYGHEMGDNILVHGLLARLALQQ